MNKIYLEPVGKVKMLVEAVEKQKELLKSKGISIDTSGLSEACRLLEDAGKKQEAIEEELKAAREDAHKRLEKLKILYVEAKLPIKHSFAPEVWNVFGIPDKR
ncbi:MAG: hypothetical protein E7092_05225 [Bacteroidales bacterium]|nr:hypothetical protein [Bacteroidales bacterium]